MSDAVPVSKRLIGALRWAMRGAIAALVGVLLFPYAQKVLEDHGAYGPDRTRFEVLWGYLSTTLAAPRIAWLAGMLGGAALAIGVVRLLIAFDKMERSKLRLPVRSPHEIEDRLPEARICVMPQYENDYDRDIGDQRSLASEVFNSIRSELRKDLRGEGPRTILVTSAQPMEGKSTIASGLAKAFSRIGWEILLVDGDMRAPSLHDVAGVELSPGLSEFLAGLHSPTGYVQRSERLSCFVMSAGIACPQPADLLDRFSSADPLERLKVKHDLTIVDGPPVLGLADAVSLAGSADYLIYVMRADRTRLDSALRALNRLEFEQSRTLVVLNHFDMRVLGPLGYSYVYDYGYGTGQKSSIG